MAQEQNEVRDPEHPPEERDRASERAVRHGAELPRAVHQVGEVQPEAGGHRERRRPSDRVPRLDQGDYGDELGGRVTDDREPAEKVRSHGGPGFYQAPRRVIR